MYFNIFKINQPSHSPRLPIFSYEWCFLEDNRKAHDLVVEMQILLMIEWIQEEVQRFF